MITKTNCKEFLFNCPLLSLLLLVQQGRPGKRGLQGTRGDKNCDGDQVTLGCLPSSLRYCCFLLGNLLERPHVPRMSLVQGVKGQRGFDGDRGDTGEKGLQGPSGPMVQTSTCECTSTSTSIQALRHTLLRLAMRRASTPVGP